ncbi:hypothetical protein CNEO3_600018 [Clostridium neonatale]|nr:hypothetical protein CNEO3_600018 [Clostridium neonatale]CAI3707878.1 hypothetical protein CNEO4_70010 [Clostridium neonatale]
MSKIIRLENSENDTSYPDIISIYGKASCRSKRNETDILSVKSLHTLNPYSNNYKVCVVKFLLMKKLMKLQQ